MCGIAGFVGDEADAPGASDRIDAMLDVQAHRGPDGSGRWTDHGVVLGHRRLAIIDLTLDGAQPMATPGDRHVITFNGEIYNYVELREDLRRAGRSFRTATDTEVLLAAWETWGEACLDRLNGMFAFAIWDGGARRLTCVRDRVGVKPLAYAWDGRTFAFASESKALRAGGFVDDGVDADAVYEYLARGYTSGGRSLHAGVKVLEPGHVLTIDVGRRSAPQIRAWWSPDRRIDSSARSAADWADEVASVLDDAVRLRLRSDVPVGAHLSGGLDSSAVVASAARHAAGAFHAFTGAFTDDAASDERSWARAVAQSSGVPMHEVEITVDDLPSRFERILWHMDEPIAGPGVFPQLAVCDLAAAHGCTVVLGGQGGDELFGGYLRHRALHWRRAMHRGGVVARGAAALELVRLAAGEWSRVRRTASRVTDEHLAPEFLDRVDPDVRSDVRRGAFAHDSVRDLMWHDLRAYLPALLHVEDRTSMAASIESRTPLLDWRLVELALTIPDDVLFQPRDPKPVLRSAVASWLPESVATRRDKKGFPTPLHHWRSKPQLAQLVHDHTDRWTSSTPSAERVFAPSYLASPEQLAASELWSVLTVNGWLDQLTRPVESPPGVRPSRAVGRAA